LEHARSELEALLKEQPENSQLIGDLALINMGLGDKAAALALSERAIAANPIEKDALRWSHSDRDSRRVAARMGEPTAPSPRFRKCCQFRMKAQWLQTSRLPPALLRLDPMFDPLRNDPRFQKLVTQLH
jgi:serine/threonine-protein kinase